jgi:hypothetical protein
MGVFPIRGSPTGWLIVRVSVESRPGSLAALTERDARFRHSVLAWRATPSQYRRLKRHDVFNVGPA